MADIIVPDLSRNARRFFQNGIVKNHPSQTGGTNMSKLMLCSRNFVPACILLLVIILFAASAAQAAPKGFAEPAFTVQPDPIIFSGTDVQLAINLNNQHTWGTIYYLGSDNKWKSVQLDGARIENTNWITGPVTAAITIPASEISDRNNLLLLSYSCKRESTWKCSRSSEGKSAWEYKSVAVLAEQPGTQQNCPLFPDSYVSATTDGGNTAAGFPFGKSATIYYAKTDDKERLYFYSYDSLLDSREIIVNFSSLHPDATMFKTWGITSLRPIIAADRADPRYIGYTVIKINSDAERNPESIEESVYVYDIITGEDVQVESITIESRLMYAEYEYSISHRQISGDNLVYVISLGGNATAYIYNIPSRQKTKIQLPPDEQVIDVKIDGNYIALTSITGNTWTPIIYLYNILTQQIREIRARDAYDLSGFSMAGNIVAWGTQLGIYAYEIDAEITKQIAEPGSSSAHRFGALDIFGRKIAYTKRETYSERTGTASAKITKSYLLIYDYETGKQTKAYEYTSRRPVKIEPYVFPGTLFFIIDYAGNYLYDIESGNLCQVSMPAKTKKQ